MSQHHSSITSAANHSAFDDPIYDGLLLNEAVYVTNEGLIVIPEDFDSLHPLIDQYVLDICSSEATAWDLQQDGKRRPTLVPFHLAKYSGLLQAFVERLWLDRRDSAYQPSSCSAILYEAMNTLHFQMAHSANPMAESGVPGWQNWELENQLIEHVRLQAVGRGFQRSDYEVRRNCLDNYETGKRFLDAVFKVHSRVQVARIDLKYKLHCRAELTLGQVQRDLNRLWANRKHKAVLTHLLGYIWSLEYTDRLRFHFHVILLYRGSDVIRPFYRAAKVGKYWEDVITQGRGQAYVCKPSHYDRTYLGEVEAGQLEKREFMLKHGPGYLTKFDQLLQIDLKKVKTFGTSAHPKKTTNAGRPRLPLERRAPRKSSAPFKVRRNDARLESAGLLRPQ
jgi:hypothetical protein